MHTFSFNFSFYLVNVYQINHIYISENNYLSVHTGLFEPLGMCTLRNLNYPNTVYGKILVRCLAKIVQIVSSIFVNFGQIVYAACENLESLFWSPFMSSGWKPCFIHVCGQNIECCKIKWQVLFAYNLIKSICKWIKFPLKKYMPSLYCVYYVF